MINAYHKTDRMVDLIDDNYRLLQVLSRFGMSLGFGDKTVDEVCRMHKVDTETFLVVINFVHSGYTAVSGNPEDISIAALIGYLQQSHVYFLDFLLPRIRRDLHAALGDRKQNRISKLILKQLDTYISSVAHHMQHEDDELFPYVEGLLRGELREGFEVSTFSKRHHAVDDDLRELKRILIKYVPDAANRNELNSVLYEIYGCEDELEAHCKAEDFILVPAVYSLEKKVRECGGK